MRKEKVSFTIDKDLMSWFRLYCKDEYKTMSSVLSEHILYLKRSKEGYTTSSNVFKSS